MLRHSVSYYLPSFWATTPLYSEKIIPLLDTYLSVASPQADKLALAYYDIWNKYSKPEEMTDESIKAFIKDLGYGYILKLMNNSSENIRALLLLLPVIAYLKESKLGLEIVLSLLQHDTDNIKITEWWEHEIPAEEDTFDMDVDLDIQSLSNTFLADFDVFLKKYIHPTLRSLKTSYNIQGEFTLIPVMTVFHRMNLKSSEKMDD